MSDISDDLAAFVPGQMFRIAGREGGPLSGLTFAAKDLFDVAGHPTGGGNPDWARTHPVPERHAWAVQTLLDAGADLIGKTITDELSLGILGENPFEGTPINPRAPGRVPGGSSAGSAAAVAAGICDIALGTDTGGSVRVPASFCGIYGMRPTHGRLDLTGMMTQAPSSDTTGWFARNADTFARVSSVMLGEPIPDALPRRLVIAADAFAFADPETATALEPMVARLRGLIGEAREEAMAPPGLSTWARAQRTLQPFEAWQTFRDWIDSANPRLQFSVARNLAQGAAVPPAERAWAQPGAGGGARPHAPALAARYDAVPADDAVPGAGARPAVIGDRPAAQPHHLPVRAWRADRGTAGQPAGCNGRWFACRVIHRRAARR